MICFKVTSVPKIGDVFTYEGKEYQLITIPTQTIMQGGLFKANARYSNSNVCIETSFYFEVNN